MCANQTQVCRIAFIPQPLMSMHSLSQSQVTADIRGRSYADGREQRRDKHTHTHRRERQKQTATVLDYTVSIQLFTFLSLSI